MSKEKEVLTIEILRKGIEFLRKIDEIEFSYIDVQLSEVQVKEIMEIMDIMESRY